MTLHRRFQVKYPYRVGAFPGRIGLSGVIASLWEGGTTTFATWDPADRTDGTHPTLTNGNLTATVPDTTNSFVFSTLPILDETKIYVELTIDATPRGAISLFDFVLGTKAINNGNAYDDGANGVTIETSNTLGYIIYNGNDTSNDASIGLNTVADVGGVAIDRVNNKLWVRRYRGSTGAWYPAGDPAAGTGGKDLTGLTTSDLYLMVGMLGSFNPTSVTLNAGASAFAMSSPSGFTGLSSGGGGPPDTTPDQFTFTDQTGAPLSTLTESNQIIVAGLGSGISVPITVTGGEYSKNGAPYTSLSGTVVNGDTVKARATSSGSASTAVNVVVTIGS